jgi:hypothetical protein
MLKVQHYIFLRALIATILTYVRAIMWRLTGSSGSAPPRPGDTSINTDWIRIVLESNGYTRFTIQSVIIGGMDNNRGLNGQINKIQVVYDSAKTIAPHPPTHFILKTSPNGFGGRSSCMFQGTHREATFYNSARFRQLQVICPRVFYSYGSYIMGELVMLQEDVSVLNAVPTNFVFGNQIWGVPAPVEPKRDQVSTLETIFVITAKQHALFWNEKSLLNESWLKGADWYRNKGRENWEHSMATCLRRWQSAKVKASKPDSGITLSDKLVSIIDKSFASSSWEKLQAHLKNSDKVPFTLCHGDYHAANMFLVRDKDTEVDRPIMFDWSEVGPWEPTTDLAQMMISDVNTSITIAHSKSLIRTYWQTLIDNGISDKEYTWETCWNAFCRGGAERWIFVFSVLADFPLPGKAIQYFHDQLFTFLATHCLNQESFELKPLVLIL